MACKRIEWSQLRNIFPTNHQWESPSHCGVVINWLTIEYESIRATDSILGFTLDRDNFRCRTYTNNIIQKMTECIFGFNPAYIAAQMAMPSHNIFEDLDGILTGSQKRTTKNDWFCQSWENNLNLVQDRLIALQRQIVSFENKLEQLVENAIAVRQASCKIGGDLIFPRQLLEISESADAIHEKIENIYFAIFQDLFFRTGGSAPTTWQKQLFGTPITRHVVNLTGFTD